MKEFPQTAQVVIVIAISRIWTWPHATQTVPMATAIREVYVHHVCHHARHALIMFSYVTVVMVVKAGVFCLDLTVTKLALMELFAMETKNNVQAVPRVASTATRNTKHVKHARADFCFGRVAA